MMAKIIAIVMNTDRMRIYSKVINANDIHGMKVV